MTPQEIKQYLLQYRETLDRASELEQHLHELRAEAIKLQDHDGKSVALDAAVSKYVDACDSAADELNRMALIRSEIVALIDSLQNDKLRSLLREIYINGKRLVQIAAERNQSYVHICRLHGYALTILSKNFENVIEC